jgi:predicted nucleic acid-binding Zn ribbon protein
MSSRRRPRPAADALRGVLSEAAPATLLAAVQRAWPSTVGAGIAAQAEPVAEREGVVTVACRTATWANELDLMQERLRKRLNAALEGQEVRALRFTADAARHRV